MAGKSIQHFDSLLGKGLENGQQQKLRENFEFSTKSWLGEKIVSKFNDQVAGWEEKHGVERLSPGDILVSFQGQEVVVPLLEPNLLKELANLGSLTIMKPKFEAKILKKLREIDPGASIKDVCSLFNQRELLSPRNDGFRWQNFEFPESLGKPQKHFSLDFYSSDEPILPSSVMGEMIEYLTSAERLSREHAAAIIKVIAQEREKYCPLKTQVKPGQIVWIGMDATERISRSKTSHKKQVPLILTLYTEREWHEALNIKKIYQLFRFVLTRLERVCFEAYHRGAVLCQAELGLMFFLNPGTISTLSRKYMDHTDIILPLAGTIKDYGRAFSHKRIIIRKHLEGWLNREIARYTHHDEESIDKYLEVFKSITILYIYGVPPLLMARILNRTMEVVKQHIDIIETFLGERQNLVSYLKTQGIKIP